MTDPTPSVSETCVRHSCKRREVEMRAHIDTLQRVLAEARAGMERRGDDMIVPMRLLDEINASGYAWKQRAEAAEASLADARRDAEALAEDFQGCGDHSRHKQAAEAWHYCAAKLRALSTQQSAGDGV